MIRLTFGEPYAIERIQDLNRPMTEENYLSEIKILEEQVREFELEADNVFQLLVAARGNVKECIEAWNYFLAYEGRKNTTEYIKRQKRLTNMLKETYKEINDNT